MTKRSSVGNFPSLQQSVLAALIGIAIGLTLGKATNHQPPFDALKADLKQLVGMRNDHTSFASSNGKNLVGRADVRKSKVSPPQLGFAKVDSFHWELALPKWNLAKLSFPKINFPHIQMANLALPKFYIPNFKIDPSRFSNLTNFDGIGKIATNLFHQSPNVVHARYSFNGFSNFVPALNQRLNVLVMGVDSNGRNTDRFANTRSDTMMIVSVDPESHRVGVVSIPRDSRVPIAGHGEDKINAAHAFGGTDLAVATVQEVFSTPIDRYVVVDVQGLKKLLELLGPVDVLVEKKMAYTDHTAGLHVELMPGLQRLDANQSEEYVRFRHDAKGDIGRIERQQWFLRQAYKKLQDPSIILKLPELYSAATECVQTNLSMDEMAKLAAFAKDLKSDQIKTAMLPGKSAMIKGGSYWLPDFDSSRLVFNRLVGTPLESSEPQFANQDVAYAADMPDNPSAYANRPISIDIRYTRDNEEAAKHLALLATTAGFNVKNRMRVDLSDCQHEQIVENTSRSNEEVLTKLRTQLPCLNAWPSVIRLDAQSPTDITLVLSPTSYVPPAPALERPSQ
jgi:LCP family protein required for cell wall assembly